MTDNLVHLRLRLTAWYAVTLGTIVLLLGVSLFVAMRGQIAAELDASLVTATDLLQRATGVREAERETGSSGAIDAVAELHIPDRSLYLFDGSGTPLVPATAPSAIVSVAVQTVRDSVSLLTLSAPANHLFRAYARRFHTRSGKTYVAIAVADRLELEDQYTALLIAFSAAAVVALVLFAAGGVFLTRKSIAPIERTMSYMRRFIADAAHELRTPLAVLRSRAEVALAAEPDPVSQREALLSIQRESIRLGKIVEDLLLLTRSDAGGWPVKMSRVFLDDITSDAVSAASTLALQSDVILSIDRFDEALIEADESLVRQLIMIILDNAIKFTPAGGSVRVSVTNTLHGPMLAVTDSGVGIPPDQLKHVFERFYRGDSARGRGNGAGLGLSIGQWIADVHHAQITLHSEGHQGTVAEVRFPAPART